MKIVLFALSILFCSTAFAQKEERFSGKYRSIMGVKNSLSCYAYNAGYLSTKSGMTMNLSFDSLKIDKVRSGALSVVGYFKEVTRESGEMDPCPSGTRKLFIVRSFEQLK